MCVRTLPSSNPALNLMWVIPSRIAISRRLYHLPSGHELIPPNATPAQTLHSKMNPTTNQTHSKWVKIPSDFDYSVLYCSLSSGLIPKCHAHKYTRTNARDDVDGTCPFVFGRYATLLYYIYPTKSSPLSRKFCTCWYFRFLIFNRTCKLGGRKDEPTVGRKDNPPARKGKDRKKKDKKKKPKKPATPPDPSTEPSSEPSIDPSTAAPE